jgi:ATP/maltotriose-dependent transcriptional regulator MalT/two-component SAPR family response regulator
MIPRSGRGAELAGWKFEPPALPEKLLARHTLVRGMERHLTTERPRGGIFLVAAPPGYGKTTVIASWAAHTAMPVAWYSLDPSDNDPVSIARGLLRALGGVLPRANWRVTEILDHLPEGGAGQGELDRITLTLVDDLRRLLATPVALVLMNVSVLSVGQGAHTLLAGLLTHQPDNLRLVLESRAVPRLPLSPLYLEHRLEGIGRDELALSDDELAALLRLYDVTLKPEETERLRALSAGWITGVLLATDAGAPRFLAEKHLTELNRQAVFDYLAAYVLDVLPADLLDFALQVSVMETITPQLANAVLQITDARDRLGALERHSGFLTRVGVGAGDPVYRLQPLLRQALLARLRKERGAERRRELHERAGQALEADERYEQAVRHHAHAQRYDRILALVEARSGALLRAGRGATLARWVAMLPPDVRAAHPRLQVLLAELYRHSGRTTRAWLALRRARVQSERDPELAARALVVSSNLRFARGDYKRARRDAEQAFALAPAGADEVRAYAGFAMASCLTAVGDAAGVSACLDRIEGDALRRRDLWVLARLYYYRSWAAMREARYTEAAHAAERALHFAQEAHDEVDAINSRLNLAIIHACHGDFVAARADLEAAADQSRRAGYALGRVYALLNRGDVERLQGDYEGAITCYQRALDAAERLEDVDARDGAFGWLGLTLALAGRPTAAIELLTSSAPDGRTDTTFSSNVLLSLGIAYYKAGDYERAVQTLKQMREQALVEHSTIRAIRAEIFLAAAHLGLEQLPETRAALRAALQPLSLEDVVPVVLPNLRLVPELRPLVEFMDDPRTRALARAFRDQRSVPVEISARRARADEAGDPTGAVRVYTLGGSRVFNGNDLTEHWRLPAARELLCFMLHQEEPVRKETLLAAIWPEKDDDLANLNFRQAVFQLKRVLGRPCLKKIQGRWLLAVDCWVDTREFERLAQEGERLAEAGEREEAVAALRQALTYHAGPYLEDVYNEWAQARREQLYLRRLAVLERLAELEEELGRDEEAAQHCYELLEDPSVYERAYRGLMRYYARRQEYGRVRDVYDRLVRELGPEIAPAGDTKALYRQLIAYANAKPDGDSPSRKAANQ